jgi:16S rRNA (uracil1498-N3)-methyltransferase
LPEIAEPMPLSRYLADRDPARLLVFCDEDAVAANPAAALAKASAPNGLAVLVGPEGGFAEDERAALVKQPNLVRLSLGPRILRADTAAVAALAVVQTAVGDWR